MLAAHQGYDVVQEPHHAHPVDVHLGAGIFEAAELQRPAYAHTGVVDEHVYPALCVCHAADGGLDLYLVGRVGLDVLHPGDELPCVAVRPVDLVPLGAQGLGHRLAEAGGDTCDKNYHILSVML